MNFLKLLGFDLKKPLKSMLQLFNLLDVTRFQGDIEKAMCLNMSAARRKVVAAELRLAATALDDNDCKEFSKQFVGILKGIKF